jgi:type II secretory ATPase GspE/PulE/Tfp pilus assembly ATPase PilB-like protein
MTDVSFEVPDIRLSIIQADGKELEVVLDHRRDRYVVGRREAIGASVDVPLPDRHVSRKHCEIAPDRSTGGWTIRDMGSSNGTRVDDELISETPVPLVEGQKITAGLTLLTVRFDYGRATSEAAAGVDGEDLLSQAPESGTTIMVLPGSLPPGEHRGGAGSDNELARMGTVMVPLPDLNGPPRAEAPVQKAPLREMPIREAPVREASVRARPQPAQPVPPPSGPEARRQDLRRAGFRGIALDLTADVFREEARMTALMHQAQETGKTFFRVVAEDQTIKAHLEIYEYVAEKLGLELVKDEKYLMENAIQEPWLSYLQASKLGAVLLAGGGKDNTVRFATVDPYDLITADWIAASANATTVHKILVLPMAFQGALQRLKNKHDDDESGTPVLVIDLDPETERQIQLKPESVDVPNIVNHFLQKSFFDGASDIHIEPTEDFLLVRNRVDGILHELASFSVASHPEIISRIKILSGMDVAEKRRPQDGRIGTLIRENAIDVRVSSYPTIYGEKVVMRLLDKNALRPSPEHLGMISRDLRLLYDKLDAPFGLVMICGPTGSGKTTTLYSCLSYIDKKTKNVLTVEDPVEYRLKGVHQMQVNEKIGLTFASGLRTILRQDPDVIMVGECRDAETAGMAIQAALTGHIVFSTIHTNDAVGVIPRLIDMGVEPFLVANAVSLCIAQRLVRRVCRHCQAPEEGTAVLERLHADGISDERLTSLGIVIDPDLVYVSGRGCVQCRNTGYQGRQAVFEIFEINQEARTEIVSPKFDANVMRRRARAGGMTTLIGHGLMLIDEGMTTHSEVIRVLGESY